MEKQNDLTVVTVLGTRPEIIRLCRVMPTLDKIVDHTIVYTNQSFDFEMKDIFFRELELRKPDEVLEVRAKTIGKQISNIIEQSEAVLLKTKPDAMLVLGDTNSSLAAIVARRMKIPIFHMEAGNRAFDWDVPEETNRRIVDHISDFNLAYTEHARRYLLAEGVHPSGLFVIGSPYPEIFNYHMTKIDASKILDNLNLHAGKYFLASIHREENVEDEKRFRELLDSLDYLSRRYGFPVVVSLHPRTRKKLRSFGKVSPRLRLYRPFGFFDYARLEKGAACVLSDSGTIAEEAAVLNIPAVQIRVSSERPEAFDSGSIILTGFNKFTISTAVGMVIEEKRSGIPRVLPRDYGDLNVSSKVAKLILGITSLQKYRTR